MLKRIVLSFFLGGLWSSCAFAVTILEGKVTEVSMYEECMVVRIENATEAFVYPNTQVSFNQKFSVALAALNSGKNVKIGHWGTGHCISLNEHEGAKPSGVFRYIYFIQQKI